MTEKEYTWYIEPLDSDTNETISQELPEQNFSHDITCQDGRTHNLWECSYNFAYAFFRSRKALNLRFNVYNKEGRHGQTRRCDFLFIKRKKKKKTVH